MTNPDTITGTHNLNLVILSIGIAIVASYTALDLVAQVKTTSGWRIALWLIGGSLAMGIGIWSMHFIGILAYRLPVPVSYNFPIVGVSMLLAVFASAGALFLVIQELSWLKLATGSIFMGLGIVAMHYTGMQAMRLAATPLYSLKNVTFSIAVAIGVSFTALWLAYHQTKTIAQGTIRKLASAVVMGIAIAGMHYTAMASVKFELDKSTFLSAAQPDNSTLAVSIGVATLILLALTFISAAIAQRIAAENVRTEILRQSEARFRALEQNSSDVIQVVNAAGFMTYTSCSMQRILGYTPQDCHEKQAFTFVYQEDLTQAKKLLQEALSHPAANIIAEFRLQHVNGEPRDFEAIACNLLAEPSVNGVVITYRDISKRKQTEADLWSALQRLTFHVENSPLAVIEWNRDFRVVRWSRAAETLFGWQAAEVLGKLPSEWNFIFPEDRATVTQVIDRLIDGSQQRNVAINRNYTKDGKVVYCEWYNSGLLDEAGNLVSVLSLILDVTQQKQTEAELVHRAAELVRLTAMLAQTNYDLQKRNQELDEFSYVVSHDLKAPLRAIANLSEWIEEDLEESLTEETRQQMNLLRGRVYRMEALINGLLQYSRVGRLETPMTSVSVATLLAEVIDSLDPPATFTIQVAPNMPTLWTYKLLLEQVFSNLISNAIKHHPRLDGTIHISSMDVGDFYQFTVADDGDGIALQYQAKVFGIFQTLSARDQKENTGIGLSIVKKIVESQGGSIWLESQAGQGAAFYFTWLKTQN